MSPSTRTSTPAPTTNFSILCFPPDSDFIVSPNYVLVPGNGAGFIVSFEITLHQPPVLILWIKPPQYLSPNSTREAADRQIRHRLMDLSGVTCASPYLPILHGTSAIGTKLCFYEFENARKRMTPRRVASDPEFTTVVAPSERWDCDVLEAGGEQRLRVLAAQVTDACERLQA